MESNNKISELRSKLEVIEKKIKGTQELVSALNDIQQLVSELKSSLSQIESVFVSVFGGITIQQPNQSEQPKQKSKKDGWSYRVLNVLKMGEKSSSEIFDQLQKNGIIPAGDKIEREAEWSNIRYTLSNLKNSKKILRLGEDKGSKYSITAEGITYFNEAFE